MRREQVLRTLEEHRDTLRGFGVRSLSLFGSCARGEETSSSDLDFLVELDDVTFKGYMGLTLFLEDLFGCHVDLVFPEGLKARVRSQVEREKVDVPGFATVS